MAVEIKPTSIDLTIPSTLTQTHKNNFSLMKDPDEFQRCPKHEQEHQTKLKNELKNRKKANSTFPRVNCIFRESKLQKKLDSYGIKIKVSLNHKRKICPADGESNNGKTFSTLELKYFNCAQLRFIQESMQKNIDSLTKELSDFDEENERHSSDKDGLQMTVRNIEELALRVMKPWVNKMPQSDEMTRVMLLN